MFTRRMATRKQRRLSTYTFIALAVLANSCASGETSFSTSDDAIDSQVAGAVIAADDPAPDATTTSAAVTSSTEAQVATTAPADSTSTTTMPSTTAPAETTTSSSTTTAESTTTETATTTSGVETTTTAATETTSTTQTESTTTTATTAAPVSGSGVFSSNCAGCHAGNGSGGIGPDIRDETSSSSVASTVQGGSGGMPSFGGKLSAEEIQAVAAFVTSSL